MRKLKKMLALATATVCACVSIGAMSSTGVSAASVVYGDVNGDGAVDLKDSVVLGRFLSGQYTLSNSTCYYAADVNTDYVIDKADVAILIDYLVLKINTLPYTG